MNEKATAKMIVVFLEMFLSKKMNFFPGLWQILNGEDHLGGGQ